MPQEVGNRIRMVVVAPLAQSAYGTSSPPPGASVAALESRSRTRFGVRYSGSGDFRRSKSVRRRSVGFIA
jgi:hypothetical protein